MFADVLEHLENPWTALRTWCARVDPGTWVVISLPNVGHCSIIADLMAGRWRYQKEGLLDRTHLRFFTWESTQELLEHAGLRIHRMNRVLNPPKVLGLRSIVGRRARKLSAREQGGISLGRVGRFLLGISTFQFLVCARTLP